MQVGIIPNNIKDKDLELTRRIMTWFKQKGQVVYTLEEIAHALGGAHIKGVEEKALYEKCDYLIAIGGDGTILSVAEKTCRKDIPLVGVNLGHLGFLADIEPQDIEDSLDKLVKGQYVIEKRMMLRAKVMSPDGVTKVFHALNDINVTRGSFSRIAEFEIRMANELIDIYPADGIIVSTPTGSTAYNLSAGGPILVPHAENYIITPICPHTIYSKSIILSQKDKIQISSLEEDKNMALSIDGQFKMYLTPAHIVEVEKSPYVTKLIKLSERKFFDILREKIVERRK